MYFNILIRDLRRKRAMNTILLLFIILAATFVSSSVSNIVGVMTALDDYFENAGVGDYYLLTNSQVQPDDATRAILNSLPSVDSYNREDVIFTGEKPKRDGEVIDVPSLELFPIDQSSMTFFDEDNRAILHLPRGEIYLPTKSKQYNDLAAGDRLTIRVGETSLELTVRGFCKDAVFGSEYMGLTRMLVNGDDFEVLAADKKAAMYLGSLYTIQTEQPDMMEQELLKADVSSVFTIGRAALRMCYILDMIIAAILLLVSVVLVLIAFIVLRFTINFTLAEEYREIGVMKAIGIRVGRIKGLYLAKYLVISLIGAAIGFAAGIPFGQLLLINVVKTMVFTQRDNYWINLACVLLVALIVVLFCLSCMRQVGRLSPIDAVRDGSGGERFRSKSVISLQRCHLRPVGFLALNDILSCIGRYVVMVMTFTLGLLIIIMLANGINTLKSDRLVTWFCMTESDAYLAPDSIAPEAYSEGGHAYLEGMLADMEATLANNGMPAHCALEVSMKLNAEKDDHIYNALVIQGIGSTADQYAYYEGTPPRSSSEVALTPLVAEKLNARIGDWIVLRDNDKDRHFLVTALFQSLTNLGNGLRLHEDTQVDYSQCSGMMAIQVAFTDAPDQQECDRRMDEIARLYPDILVFDGAEYVDYLINVADKVDVLKTFLIPLMLLICILVTVLMERSFIEQEKGEIAMLKACGFGSGTVVCWHTLRMGLVLLLASVIAALLSTPATKLLIEPLFCMMGATSIDFEIKPLEVFVIYPLIMMAATLSAAFLAALGTRRITAADTAAGIE